MSKGAFGEPLQVQRNGLGQDTAGVLDRDGKLLPYNLDTDGRLPHWRRIVTCVNAMDGVEDPAGFVLTAMYNKANAVFFAKQAIEVEKERDELREMVRSLANQISGLGAFEHEVREVIGNTNWNVKMHWVDEARKLLGED